MTGKLKATIAVLLVVALICFFKSGGTVTEPVVEIVEHPSAQSIEIEVFSQPIIGDVILRDYASASTSLTEDLELLRRVNISFVTLVKNHANLAIGCNADLADALRGKNDYKQRFISDSHPALNDKGQIIDRYLTPIHLHVPSAGRYEIRSAGADKTLWTEDDVEILPSGLFR